MYIRKSKVAKTVYLFLTLSKLIDANESMKNQTIAAQMIDILQKEIVSTEHHSSNFSPASNFTITSFKSIHAQLEDSLTASVLSFFEEPNSTLTINDFDD